GRGCGRGALSVLGRCRCCHRDRHDGRGRRNLTWAKTDMGEIATLPLDAETKVAERPADHEAELRLWLRLLTCTTLIENEIRQRLRTEFDITLPRFDLMAQLD